jgi:hypothetical protein
MQSRVAISCNVLDAVKVVEHAKLTVQTDDGEFSAPLTELHDSWWNSIARAMA